MCVLRLLKSPSALRLQGKLSISRRLTPSYKAAFVKLSSFAEASDGLRTILNLIERKKSRQKRVCKPTFGRSRVRRDEVFT